MKVAIYAGMFKRNQDGATKTLYELVGTLLNQGMEVGVWAFTVSPWEAEGLSLFTIPSVPLPFYPEYKISLPGAALKRQLDEFNPQVLHITVPDMVGASLMRYARRKGIPVVTSYHTDFPSYLESYGLGFLYKPAWRYFKRFYNKSRSVMAPTSEMIGKLKNNGIENVSLWSRGIHLNSFGVKYRSSTLRKSWDADGKKVILFAGRFVWYKDLATFVKVYKLFKQMEDDSVRFVLAGDGPIREELEKEMPGAHFTGYLGVPELAKVYASADLLLFPSTTETFGNVVLEALASGTPAVVSDEGGCQEIVNEANAGLVVKAKDEFLFYRACRRILGYPGLYMTFQQNGLDYAAKQDWQEINNHVIDQYRSALGHPIPAAKSTKSPVPALSGNSLSGDKVTAVG